MENTHQELKQAIQDLDHYFKGEYTLLPVATAAEVLSFEQKFNLQLPEDFKWYLLNIANGIVDEAAWGFDLVSKIELNNFLFRAQESNPSLPFVHTSKIKFIVESESENDEDEYPYEIAYHKYFTHNLNFSNGTITLAGMGCGTAAFLVVNGEEYGKVWIEDISSNDEVYPQYDFDKDKKRLNFEEWLIAQINWKIKHHLDLIEMEEEEKRSAAQAQQESMKSQEQQRRIEKESRAYDREAKVRTFQEIMRWVVLFLLIFWFLLKFLN